MNRNLKIISVFMVLVLCLSFSAAANQVKTKDQIIQDKIKNKEFVTHQQWHDKDKFDREVAGNLNLKVQSTKNKVPDGFEPAPDGYQTMVSYKTNGKIHIRDTDHKVETIQVPWNEITSLPGFDGSTVLITHYNDLGIKDGVWVQEVYNLDGFAYLEEIPFSEVVVSGFTGVYQFTPAGNFTPNDEPGIGYTFDSDFVNYLNASFETIYDDTDPYPQYSTDGLVGWWRFDEGTGTLVQDFSVNDNNGTAQNGMGWNVKGLIEGSGEFDGTDDYANVSSSSELNISETITMISWASVDDSTINPIVSKWNNSFADSPYFLRFSSDTEIRSGVGDGTTAMHLTVSGLSGLNQYNHIASVIDVNSAEKIKIYFNGNKLSGSLSGDINTIILTDDDLELGRLAANYMNGSIDNVMIYNRALSPTEISTNYQIGYNEYFSKDDPYDIPTRGLVGWWRFDEGSGTNVSDSSGNGNHGTFAAANYTNGKYNDGGDFDGVNESILVPNSDSLDIPESHTICFWSYRYDLSNQADTAQDVIRRRPSGKYNYNIDIPSSTYKFRYTLYDGSNIPTVSSTFSGVTDEWVFWTFVRDVDDQKMKIYRNKEFDIEITDTTAGNVINGTSNTFISGVSPNSFNGTIDDVMIYNRSLSEEEIEQLYYIKTSQLATRTNSNSTYSGFWNNSTDNPTSVPFGAGESISSLRFDNTSSIVQNGITIYEPENMLFNLSVEVGHTENTTNIYEEVNGDSYQVFIQHIPGVDSVSGTVEFTSDANDILSSPYLTTGMDTNNTNASMSFNVATRKWTVTTGAVVANQTYNYVLYGVLEGVVLEDVVEGGFGNDNMEAFTASGNDTVIVGSVHTATYGTSVWGNISNDLYSNIGGLITLAGVVTVLGVVIAAFRRFRDD